MSQGLLASGTAALDLATFDGLPAGTYGVRASGDQPLTLKLELLTTYTTPPPSLRGHLWRALRGARTEPGATGRDT